MMKRFKKKPRRGRRIRTKVKAAPTTEQLADRAMRQMAASFKRAGLNLRKPDHQAIALSATVTAAATLAAAVDGMTAEEFGAFAEVQFERIKNQGESPDAEEPQ